MGRVVALGEGVRVRCYGLAGADVMVADDEAAAREAWGALPPDTVLAVLTAAAAAAVAGRAPSAPQVLAVVMDG